MLEAHYEQYQKAKERGHANLASITAATSSLHIDAMSKSKPSCYKCGYSHPNGKCLAKGHQCYVCSGYNHYTVLCQQKGCRQNKQWRGFKPNKCFSSHGHCTSHSPHRHCRRSHSSCSHSRTPSCSPSCGTSHRHSSCSKRHSTPHRSFQDAIDVIPADSVTTGNWAEGNLFMERASDGQVAFFTCMNLPAQSGTKTMVVKIDPGTQVNTIPLSRYHTLFPNKLTESRYPKAKSLMPTHHTWISHNGLPKPFLGHFIVEVAHAKDPRTYPIRFYVFENATHPQMLLSYATSKRLGIITFQVPNLAATHSLNHVAVHTPSGKRRTAKQVTFQDPISMTEGSHTSSNPPDRHHGKRKTTAPNKGEEALTSSHCKTTNTNQEVKVGSSILSKTLPLPQAPNTPASKTIRQPTLVNAPLPSITKSILCHPEVQLSLVTSPHNVSQVQDIMVLRRAFPDSFDTIGNMPGTYTISNCPSVPLVQHARQKVPIEYRDQIEKVPCAYALTLRTLIRP